MEMVVKCQIRIIHVASKKIIVKVTDGLYTGNLDEAEMKEKNLYFS